MADTNNIIKKIEIPVKGVATNFDIVDQGGRDLISSLTTDNIGAGTTDTWVFNCGTSTAVVS